MTVTRPLPTANIRVILDDVQQLAAELARTVPTCRDQLREWSGGPLRSPNTNGNGGHQQGAHADPTALTATTGHPVDPAGTTLLTLDRRLLELRELAYEIAATIARTSHAHTVDELDECWLCAAHGGISVRVYSRRAAGNGDPIRARCSWHHDQLERYGRDLHQELTLWHHQHPGARSTNAQFVRLLRHYHADLWAQFHAGLAGATGEWQDRTA